jgi:hypothetical protein
MQGLLRTAVCLFLITDIVAEPEITINSAGFKWKRNRTTGEEVVINEGVQTNFFCRYPTPVNWKTTGVLVRIVLHILKLHQ